MSTVGFLTAPLAFDFVRSWVTELEDVDWNRAGDLFADMEAEGLKLLASSGISADEVTHRREVDMRYVGQGHEIRVPVTTGRLGSAEAASLRGRFEEIYLELYERTGPPVRAEILNWRVVSAGPRPEIRLDVEPGGSGTPKGDTPKSGPAAARKGSRPAYFPELGGFAETAVYDRYSLHPRMRFDGPAIVEERESTVIIGPGASCRIDRHHNLVVDMPTEGSRS